MNANDMVLAGVRLLDEKGPANWRETLKKNATVNEPFDNLNMAYGRPIEGDTSGCVLMHIFGSFSRGCDALGIRTYDAHAYGFEVVPYDAPESDDRPRSEHYHDLNAAWKGRFTCA